MRHSFQTLNLQEPILHAISDLGFHTPSPIQEQAIPAILNGKDIIGKSHTGTGKTLAFGIPALSLTGRQPITQVLILCPTRELAVQSAQELRKFAKYMEGIKITPIYGGEPIQQQIAILKKGVQIVVGTPGRILDHIRRKTLKLSDVRLLVLDEADEMLRMGFREDIEAILAFVTAPHQTLLFSATIPDEIARITHQYQKNPVLIDTSDSNSKTLDTIEQFYFVAPRGKKPEILLSLLQQHNDTSSIIFCNTKKKVEEICRYLNNHHLPAAAIHGDMKQNARLTVMRQFKEKRIGILVATDVAARGIDVAAVDAVYNFDIPQDHEFYIHRIGRTGRAGKAGKSYSIVSGKLETAEIQAISKYIGSPITAQSVPMLGSDRDNKQQLFFDDILSHLKAGTALSHPMIADLAAQGFSYEKICNTILHCCLEKLDIDFQSPPTKSTRQNSAPSTSGETIQVRFNIGKSHSVSPNQILQAIIEQTHIPNNQIKKITCFADYSLAEVPLKFRTLIVKQMNGQKIAGKTVTASYASSHPLSVKKSGRTRQSSATAASPGHRRGSTGKRRVQNRKNNTAKN